MATFPSRYLLVVGACSFSVSMHVSVVWEIANHLKADK